jgi:lipoate-protein ligase A
MRLLDLTLATAEENLALDEALLDEAETANEALETLRIWESTTPLVVVGRSSSIEREVNLPHCRECGIKVLRRTSGGAAIVTGPGCLMYSLVFSYDMRPALRSLDRAHALVLSTIATALLPAVPQIARHGTSDLAIGSLKCSGNSVRCKRRAMLYHGTLLYDFDVALIEHCLRMPPRMPEYRHGRSHSDFVTNLPLDVRAIRKALIGAWGNPPARVDFPRERVSQLATTRYSQPSWNLGS